MPADTSPKWLALASSPRQRRAREDLAELIAKEVGATTTEACDLVEGALLRLEKLTVGDRRHLQNLRAHVEAASLLRSGGASCTGLHNRRTRDLEDGATEVAHAVVKPTGTPLNRTVRYLLIHPPTLETTEDD